MKKLLIDWATDIDEFDIGDGFIFALPSRWYPLQTKMLSVAGEYEPATAAAIEQHFPDGGVFLNVGASAGYHVLKLAIKKNISEAHLLEINPLLAPILHYNCRKLRKTSSIYIYPFGASSDNGLLEFPLASNGMGGIGIDKPSTAAARTYGYVSTIDDLHIDNVSLVLVDVEGHEFRVLMGACETIEASNPVLVIELNRQISEKNSISIWNWIIGDLMYKAYAIRANTLEELRSLESWVAKRKEHIVDGCRDVILLPPKLQ